MNFEDTQTSVFVNIQSKLIDNSSKSGFKDRIFLSIPQRVIEDYQIWHKRVFVHLTDAGETSHGKVKNSSSSGRWSIALTSLLDLGSSYLSFLYIFWNLSRHLFCWFESHDQRFVIKKRSRWLWKGLKKLIFFFFEFFSVLTHLMNQLLSLFLFFWFFKRNNHIQKLISETHHCDSEVYNHGLTHNFRSIFGIW